MYCRRKGEESRIILRFGVYVTERRSTSEKLSENEENVEGVDLRDIRSSAWDMLLEMSIRHPNGGVE